MRQFWFSSLSPVTGRVAAAMLALLLSTANAPAQSRSDSGRDDSDSSVAGDRNNDRASTRDNQANENRLDQSGQPSRRSQSAADAGRQATHPLLGVMFYNDEFSPLEVRRVLPDTPAEDAGIERGDEILSVDGRRVSSVQQLRQEIDGIGTDEDIEFGVLRDGRQQTITARLTSSRTTAGGNRGRRQPSWGGQQYGGYNQSSNQRQSRSGNSEYDQGFRDGYAQALQAAARQGGRNQSSGGQSYMRGSRDTGNQQDDQSQWSNRYSEGYRGSSSSDQAFLGIMLDQNKRDGVRVASTYSNSPAQQAGLRPGDEILSIDDEDVRSSHDVQHILSQRDPDDSVMIEVDRNGRQRTLHATLGSRQEFSNRGTYRTGRRANSGQNQQGTYRNNQRQQEQSQDEDDDSHY